MDHIKVLKRAWETTWRYRALWIFGVILALTTASGAGPGAGNQAQYNVSGEDFSPGGEFYIPEITPEVVSMLIAIGVGLACVIVTLIVAATVARYVAETALIRMVDHYEETGEKLGVRQGFRLGWSRTAWRLFLIGLLTGLPLALAFLLLFVLTAILVIPSVMAINAHNVTIGVIGIVAAVGLFFLGLFTLILASVALSLFRQFFWRACTLEEVGVIEAIRQGLGVVMLHWQDVLIMWLIMIGVNIGWAIALLAITILLFPVILLLIVVGGVLGGLPALLVWGLASLFFEGAMPWIVAGLIGLPIFILVVAAPGVFLSGLMEVFKSSTWTLTYRELRALEGLEIEIETETEEWAELGETDLNSPPDGS